MDLLDTHENASYDKKNERIAISITTFLIIILNGVSIFISFQPCEALYLVIWLRVTGIIGIISPLIFIISHYCCHDDKSKSTMCFLLFLLIWFLFGIGCIQNEDTKNNCSKLFFQFAFGYIIGFWSLIMGSIIILCIVVSCSK